MEGKFEKLLFPKLRADKHTTKVLSDGHKTNEADETNVRQGQHSLQITPKLMNMSQGTERAHLLV